MSMGISLKSVFRFAVDLSIGYGAIVGVYGVTALLLPSDTTYLKNRGLDPAIARTLSDAHIRVRSDNFGGNAHVFLQSPYGYIRNGRGGAHAFPGPLYYVTNLCPVSLPKKGETIKETLKLAFGIPPHMIENNPLSASEYELSAAMHEFSHCDSSQRNMSEIMGEADADVKGFLGAAKALGKPEMGKTLLYMRALASVYHSHDTTLYVDAHLRGMEKPTEAQMEAAMNEITEKHDLHGRTQIRLVKKHMMDEPAFRTLLADGNLSNKIAQEYLNDFIKRKIEDGTYYAESVGVMRSILQNNTLSPWAKRRAELYVEAAEYFTPSLARAKTAPTPAAPQLSF